MSCLRVALMLIIGSALTVPFQSFGQTRQNVFCGSGYEEVKPEQLSTPDGRWQVILALQDTAPELVKIQTVAQNHYCVSPEGALDYPLAIYNVRSSFGVERFKKNLVKHLPSIERDIDKIPSTLLANQVEVEKVAEYIRLSLLAQQAEMIEIGAGGVGHHTNSQTTSYEQQVKTTLNILHREMAQTSDDLMHATDPDEVRSLTSRQMSLSAEIRRLKYSLQR